MICWSGSGSAPGACRVTTTKTGRPRSSTQCRQRRKPRSPGCSRSAVARPNRQDTVVDRTRREPPNLPSQASTQLTRTQRYETAGRRNAEPVPADYLPDLSRTGMRGLPAHMHLFGAARGQVNQAFAVGRVNGAGDACLLRFGGLQLATVSGAAGGSCGSDAFLREDLVACAAAAGGPRRRRLVARRGQWRGSSCASPCR